MNKINNKEVKEELDYKDKIKSLEDSLSKANALLLEEQQKFNDYKKFEQNDLIRVDTEGKSQNKKVKDTSFKMLCKEIDGLVIDLYNYAQDYISYKESSTSNFTALSDKKYLEGEISLFNLDIIADDYYPYRNDISFTNNDNTIIYLFEAQTKYSKEMAFRCMDYYCRLVNKKRQELKNKNMYNNSESILYDDDDISIDLAMKYLPKPEFYVFYFQDMKKKFTKLEDNFKPGLGKSEFLDCTVHNIQLSEGMFNKLNQEKQCMELKAYCIYNDLYDKSLKSIKENTNIKLYKSEKDFTVAVVGEALNKTYQELINHEDYESIRNTKFIELALREGFMNMVKEEKEELSWEEIKERLVKVTTQIVTAEVTERVREEARAEVTERVREEAREEVTERVTAEVTERVREEARAEVTERVREEAREEVRKEARAEVTESIIGKLLNLGDIQLSNLTEEELQNLLN